jgi:hypothetical protein
MPLEKPSEQEEEYFAQLEFERRREVGMQGSRQPAPARQCRNRAGNGLQELLLHMAQALVDVPELVTVSATEGQYTVVLEVRMAPTDVGKGF